jgi:hypothetical protein
VTPTANRERQTDPIPNAPDETMKTIDTDVLLTLSYTKSGELSLAELERKLSQHAPRVLSTLLRRQPPLAGALERLQNAHLVVSTGNTFRVSDVGRTAAVDIYDRERAKLTTW